MYSDVFMISRMKERTVNYHIGIGGLPENIEFEMVFVYTDRKVQEVNLGTLYFDRKLNARVKSICKKFQQLGFVTFL